MDYVIVVVQGGSERQHRVFDSTVRALKSIFPSLPGEAKDLVLVKKLLAGEGDWEFVKKVPGWIIDTEAGTVALPERKLQELQDLLDIPTSQQQLGKKELERLVGKLRSMHLAVPGAVAHLYHIQCVLSQAGTDRAWLSPDFHREIVDWNTLTDQTADQPTHIAEIVRRKPTHLGCCGASGLGAGVVWLDPSHSGKNMVCRHPWPPDIIADLISSTNR